MPTYDYKCVCGWSGTRYPAIDDRDKVLCPECLRRPTRLLAAPLFKIDGRVTPGGGPDRFTADMLGIPLKELPEGLKTKR